MIVYDVATKVRDTELFPQYNIADLNSGITLVLFSQEQALRWKEINTHIYTHQQQLTASLKHVLLNINAPKKAIF